MPGTCRIFYSADVTIWLSLPLGETPMPRFRTVGTAGLAEPDTDSREKSYMVQSRGSNDPQGMARAGKGP